MKALRMESQNNAAFPLPTWQNTLESIEVFADSFKPIMCNLGEQIERTNRQMKGTSWG